MPQVDALITPSVMKWAREQAGYDISTAAHKLVRPEADVEGWENGTLRPSIAQARKASEVYKRSLAVFYLPEPPRDFQTLRDFRHLPDEKLSLFSPELSLLIRRVQARQRWLHDWIAQQGQGPIPFIGTATTSTPAVTVAGEIRKTLGISPQDQMSCQTRREALNLWIERTEAAGVSVCREGGIECDEARGFVLTDELAPFIYLNTEDARVAQLFTLVHELSHLWINEPGISNLENLNQPARTDAAKIEVFCNRVAGETLLDQETFNLVWRTIDRSRPLVEQIEHVSSKVKVSEEVVARRLLDRGAISNDQYLRLRKEYIERWKRMRRQEREKNRQSSGGPSPHLMRVLESGRNFAQTVLGAYFGGAIPAREASSLLRSKVNNLSKVAEYAGIAVRSRGQIGGVS